MRIRIAAALVALTAVLVPLAPVSGQSETPTGIETAVVPADMVARLTDQWSTLQFWADGELCRALDLRDEAARDDDGNAIFVLGGPGQPASCGTEGQRIRVTTESLDFEWWDTFVFAAGARVELSPTAPPPPGSIPPVIFWVTPEAIAAVGQVETILVRAGDDVCLELDLRDADEQGLSAGIGYADQPNACADIEAVFVTSSDGSALPWSLRIAGGEAVSLIAEPPPESTPPAPNPPDAGGGSAQPVQPGLLPYSVATGLIVAGVAIAATAVRRRA